MFNLIFKDMRNFFNKRVILSYLLYMPMMIYVIGDNYEKVIDSIFFIGSMLIIPGGMTTFLEDEKSKWDIVINSLPVQKSKIVFCRYLDVVMQIMLYLVFVTIVITLGNCTTLININLFNKRALIGILNMNSIVLIFTAIVFPLYFKYGVMKLRSINILMVIILFSIIGGSGFLFWLADVRAINIVIIINLVCLTMFIASSIISVKIYTNKDIG